MTVYEHIRNFTITEMAELFTNVALSSAKGATAGIRPDSEAIIESQRERIRDEYIQLLNEEVSNLAKDEK